MGLYFEVKLWNHSVPKEVQLVNFDICFPGTIRRPMFPMGTTKGLAVACGLGNGICRLITSYYGLLYKGTK